MKSVSNTIAKTLGLNIELAKVITIVDILGHTPFGRLGETVVKNIAIEKLGKVFWHEK